MVSALRSASQRYPADTRTQRLVRELNDGSSDFRDLWARPAHPGGRSGEKTVHHAAVGAVTLNYDVLEIPDSAHRILLFTAAPGSRAEKSLRELADVPQSADVA